MSANDSPSLLIDASTPWLHAGVMSGGAWLALERAEGDAVTLLPELVRLVLHRAGLRIADMRTLIHCEGPGSLLGLRLAAMLMETWRAMPSMTGVPLFAYRSLAMAAALPAAIPAGGDVFSVVTPFRRGSYCVCASDGTDLGLVDEAGLAALKGRVLVIPQRRLKDIPPNAQALDYDLAPLPGIIQARPDLLRRTDHAIAFSPQLSQYQPWDGQRHRAATV